MLCKLLVDRSRQELPSGVMLLFDEGLPEDKWRGVVVNADMLFSAAGRLKILFDLGATATCQHFRHLVMRELKIEPPRLLKRLVRTVFTDAMLQVLYDAMPRDLRQVLLFQLETGLVQ